MRTIKLSKGSPRKPRYKYPVRTMKINDTFFVPGKTRGWTSSFRYYYKKTLGFTFEIDLVTEHGVKGVRVWRNT
jgi:hypothetical protein